MKILFYFFASSISTAILNYLFQVILALKLGPHEFAQFTLSWSFFGIASILGAFFQYWASLNSIQAKIEKRIIFIVYFVASFLITSFLLSKNIFLLVLALALINVSLSLKIGHAIGIGNYRASNFINLNYAAFKILALFVSSIFFNALNSEKVFYIILAGFILAEVVYGLIHRKLDQFPRAVMAKVKDSNWFGPILFSILLCTLPQLDVLWVNWFKDQEELALVSQLSFLSKGMFFLQVIVAQWVFSKQKKNPDLFFRKTIKYGIGIFVLLILASLVGSYVLPVLISKFLSWPTVPTVAECFGASVSAGMMSLFYQACQLKLIAKKNYQILASLIFIAFFYLSSGIWDLNLVNYFFMVSVAYLLVILGMLFWPSKMNVSSSKFRAK